MDFKRKRIGSEIDDILLEVSPNLPPPKRSKSRSSKPPPQVVDLTSDIGSYPSYPNNLSYLPPPPPYYAYQQQESPPTHQAAYPETNYQYQPHYPQLALPQPQLGYPAPVDPVPTAYPAQAYNQYYYETFQPQYPEVPQLNYHHDVVAPHSMVPTAPLSQAPSHTSTVPPRYPTSQATTHPMREVVVIDDDDVLKVSKSQVLKSMPPEPLPEPTDYKIAPTAKQEKPSEVKPKKPRAKKPKTEPELCEEQRALVDLILSGRNVFYTGSAGCGKSTVLKAFVKELRQRGKNVVIVAPTGRAALEVNGSTYFTFASWVPDSFKKPIKDLRKAAHGKWARKKMMDVQVLVVDEISMVENYAFERLNEVMQEARGNSKAFGGVQLVVTGDFCQLPPVKPFQWCFTCGRSMVSQMAGSIFKCPQHGEVPEVDKWAFRSSAWKQCEFQHVNLTTIHRQRDRKYIDILERCRMGKTLTPKDTELLLNHKCNVKNAVKLFSTRDEVRRVNLGEFNKLPAQKRSFKSFDHFRWQPQHGNLRNKDVRGPDGSFISLREHKFEPAIELKVGMLVVLQVNMNIEEGLVNGSQGVIVGWENYDPAKMPKHVDRENKTSATVLNPILGDYAVLRESNIKAFIDQATVKEWPVVQFDNGVQKTIFADCVVNELGDESPYSLLSRTQIPLLAGWAMTVHKSQGMTLNRVVVDLSKSFEEGQMYVALSRARSLGGLKVEGLGRWRGGGNEQVMEFLKEKFGID